MTLSTETGLPLFPEVIFPRAALCSLIGVCVSHLDVVLRAYASPLVRGTYVEAPEDGTSRRRTLDLRNAGSRILTLAELAGLDNHIEAIDLFRSLESLQGYRVLGVNGDVFTI